MASVRVNMRVPEDLWAAVSKYAEERGSNNTAVVVGALRSFLDDAGRGVPELEEAPVPNPPAPPRVPEFSPAPDFGPLVRRGSDVLGPEPNVDRFEKTDDYRRAMALYRERRPWEQLMKGRRDG
jgi:hypothetical protein